MKTSRRKFVTAATVAALGLTFPVHAKKSSGKLIHHVFFWMNNPDDASDKDKLLEGLNTLRKIDALRDFRIGVPAATEKREVIESSYDFSLFTAFDDIKGHDAYQVDPVHLKFIDNYKHLWSKVIVYDVKEI
ncbi:MAG TPA: Dabb family protein [Cyclobacteriaceae bacterium]|nr:Dabb family protein [Cyclobacteriaceae bacterium]